MSAVPEPERLWVLGVPFHNVSNADTIILPPEFFESEKKNESKKAPATATKKNAESKK